MIRILTCYLCADSSLREGRLGEALKLYRKAKPGSIPMI